MLGHSKNLRTISSPYLKMQEDYCVYGAESFELSVLAKCDSSIMFKVESEYIKHYRATSYLYNEKGNSGEGKYYEYLDSRASNNSIKVFTFKHNCLKTKLDKLAKECPVYLKLR